MKTWNDFKKIVLEEIPLIDVRAPIEFNKGAFINTVNLPIMDDEERRKIGICYKEHGNEKAVKLGHKLVAGEVKEQRVEAWKNCLIQKPESIVYCFRGGMRSQITQEWIFEATGRDIPRIEGGFKAFRNYLINTLKPENINAKPILLGGCTGAGKTILLNKLNNAIDLEALANHRGSSFGRKITAQPQQIQFENDLAYRIIQNENRGFKYMLVEDEGRNVGSCMIPKDLAEFFKAGELIVLEASMEKRVQNTMKEYVVDSQKDYISEYGLEQGIIEWKDYIYGSIKRIQKRLGGDRFIAVNTVFEEAIKKQLKDGSIEGHETWIEILLRDYYDPMYLYQLKNKKANILFQGQEDEVLQFLKEKSIGE